MSNTITPTWTTKDGTTIPIPKMTTSHIINCVKMLEKNAEKGVVICGGYCGDEDFQSYEMAYGAEYLEDFTDYDLLVDELIKRNQFPIPTND